jgi:L-alanine-DL-glutamate epimerase-like enolase superfamily enzyme
MRVEALEFFVVHLPRRWTFRTARTSSDTATQVLVRLVADGVEGWGNACPNTVTGETAETIVAALDTIRLETAGFRFERPLDLWTKMQSIVADNRTAKAGVDIAAWDITAKAAGKPLYAVLGGARDRFPTDMTLSLLPLRDTLGFASRHAAEGFRALKVKVGEGPEKDIPRVLALREAVGNQVELRVDANQAYTADGALEFLRGVEPAGIALLEQPVPASDLEGMQRLTSRSDVPIVADEAAMNAEDVMRLRWGLCCGGVNIKVMKCGGITPALEMAAACESAAFPVMVGCMGESSVSILAGLHFALAQKSLRWLDLDSHLNLARDVCSPPDCEAGHLTAPSRPGLGVEALDVPGAGPFL